MQGAMTDTVFRADFTHNITDGLALSSSFYASPTIGATTTVAVFFHEIPHEVGDFALLIQSGFSKRAAMGAQFITAVGALLGTCIGIAVQEYSGGVDADSGSMTGRTSGIFGTSLGWGDMLLPFTAGTFLYVGTVAVIPELLETGKDKAEEVRQTLTQFAAMAAGAGIMIAYVSFFPPYLNLEVESDRLTDYFRDVAFHGLRRIQESTNDCARKAIRRK